MPFPTRGTPDNSAGSPAAVGYNPECFTQQPWSMGRMIKVWPWVFWGAEEARGGPSTQWTKAVGGAGSTPTRGAGGDHAAKGFVQFTRPDLSSRLSPVRLCHCSFSSLAWCPTPEEKNKKDEAPALPRWGESLSVTMGTPSPPQTPPG